MYNCPLHWNPPPQYLPPPWSPSLIQSTRHRPSSDTGADLIGWPSTSAPLATTKFYTQTLTSTSTLFYGTLSPTHLQKPKILSSQKLVKFASGAKKATRPTHLPSIMPHRFSTSQFHHTSLSNPNTTRLSELSCTHRKPYLQ